MHKYWFHIGDFNNATMHLDKEARWFYRDLIDIYYDYEQPLQDDFAWICRKLRAKTEHEETLVEQVLLEFFILEEDGWHHAKCDEVLAEYHENAEKKSKAGKASAAARAKKRKASKKDSTEGNTCSTGVPNQKPETRNQIDIYSAEALTYLNEKSGRQFRNATKLKARLKQFTLEEVKQVIDYKVREWKGTKMEKYIRPETLFQESKFEGYLNDAKSNLPHSEGNQQTGASSSEQVSAAIQQELARQSIDTDDMANHE